MALYAALAYLLFLASIVWAVGFLANAAVPKTIDVGQRSPWPSALAFDAGLLLLFAVQHSVMARKSIKRFLARFVPPPAERSSFVHFSSAVLLLLFWQWRPLPAIVWQVEWAPAAAALNALYVAGWAVVVASTFMINHFDFLGLRQAYLFAKSRAYESVDFKERWLYGWVRHPMMLGLLVAFWATPTMTAGHLVFAGASTGYILLGTLLEERDLRQTLGAIYEDYVRRVPAFLPIRRSHGLKAGAVQSRSMDSVSRSTP